MKKIYAEVGLGNDTFLSTEIEDGINEHRVPGFSVPKNIESCYFRFWILKKVYIFSTNRGFEVKDKDRNKLKILFGISGEVE